MGNFEERHGRIVSEANLRALRFRTRYMDEHFRCALTQLAARPRTQPFQILKAERCPHVATTSAWTQVVSACSSHVAASHLRPERCSGCVRFSEASDCWAAFGMELEAEARAAAALVDPAMLMLPPDAHGELAAVGAGDAVRTREASTHATRDVRSGRGVVSHLLGRCRAQQTAEVQGLVKLYLAALKLTPSLKAQVHLESQQEWYGLKFFWFLAVKIVPFCHSEEAERLERL